LRKPKARPLEEGKAPEGAQDDNVSDLSNMMVKSNALKNFENQKLGDQIEVPPTANSRRFNECDIIGNLERDDKGNVIPIQAGDGSF